MTTFLDKNFQNLQSIATKQKIEINDDLQISFICTTCSINASEIQTKMQSADDIFDENENEITVKCLCCNSKYKGFFHDSNSLIGYISKQPIKYFLAQNTVYDYLGSYFENDLFKNLEYSKQLSIFAS